MKIDLSKYDKLSDKQWQDKVVYRGLHVKYKHQLNSLRKLYPEKVERLQNRIDFLQFDTEKPEFDRTLKLVEIFGLEECLNKELVELESLVNEEVEFLDIKIERLTDKYGAVLKEIELRDKKLVKRSPKGTIYYIDLDSGDDAKDGLTTGNAWLTIGKYTTVESRSPGDIAKVRANTSQILVADILFDEDGNVDNFIEIRGCSIADDPWGDSSDVQPVIDFNSTSYQFKAQADTYWKIYNLEVKNSTDSSGAVLLYLDSNDWLIEKCKIHDNSSKGIYAYMDSNRTVIKDCDFDSNNYSIYAEYYNTDLIVKNCTFDGDVRAIYIYSYSSPRVIAIDCSFGQSVAITTSDIHLSSKVPTVIARNCKWDKGITYGALRRIDRWFEDDNQVFEAHKFETLERTVERDTVVTRPGGADSSAKITPKSVVGINRVASLSGYPNGISPSGAFRIWLSSGVEKTINIYIKGFGWTGFPTATQLFIRASYYGNAGNCVRTILDSDEVISDNTTWVPFQVTLTPARTGFVYVDAIVAYYEALSGVNVDIDTSNIT